MASGWDVAAAAWATTVLGWLVSPILRSLLPKILAYLGFDPSKELQIQIIPELKSTMRAVDQERMTQRGHKVKTDLDALDKMAAMLRHAQDEVEDIFHDAQHVVVFGDTLDGAVEACIARCNMIARIIQSGSSQLLHKMCLICMRIAGIIRSGWALLLQWAQKIISLYRLLRMRIASVIQRGSAQLLQWTQKITSLGRFILIEIATLLENSCRFTFYWLVEAFMVACSYRDWSYSVIGITSYQENDTALDSVLTAISRWKLKKRIENIGNTVSEVKKSPLLAVASYTRPNDIANKNRSRIRAASKRKVFGREVLRDDIMARLRETPLGDAPRSSTGPCYSVIGIYGVAGSGKTTFAGYIRDYIKEECKEEKLFDTIMCIHVSKTFSVDDIFHEMLKDITGDWHSNISDREELEEKLKESLCDKRFFLILDDLWVKNKNNVQLEELMSPLNVGMKGSKILVTARTKDAARALCANELIEMPDLDDDQYLKMFIHYALGGRRVTDEEEFIRIGRVIAKRLHRSPIAAVTVAGRLGTSLDISFWKKN